MADHQLILGGQRSGKSRCAELRAASWLATAGREAVLVATALAGDGEMHERIVRHRLDRAARVPGLATVEEPRALAQAVLRHSRPGCLVLVDCLTLWLTNLLMPLHGEPLGEHGWVAERDGLCEALRQAAGPVVLVSNEIGLGLTPMDRETRRFVDALGWLHQSVAGACSEVTLMVAGIEVPVKRKSCP
jgi:adenosylcobinamide kinase/adenosylcobinamide-phosphate guanylyltransferase